MHVHSPFFHGQLKENKNRPITSIVWVLVKKYLKKGKKMKKNIVFCFKQISKCDTCFYMLFFKNIVFKSVALVTKKL